MHSLKDKVAEKLSHLFADQSPSPPTSPQARPDSKDEKSSYSILSFITRSKISGGSKPNNHVPDVNSYYSTPRGFHDDFKENSICENRELGNQYKDDKVTSSVRKDEKTLDTASSDSDVFEEANDHTPTVQLSDLTDDSAFISSNLYEFLQSSLPNIVKGRKWVLLYSTSRHGISLRTLIRKSAELSGPSLLIAGDTKGAVFGAMLECPLKPTPKRKYQGTNQTFVFTTVYGEPRIFRPTGANRYYYMCLNELLAFGGGGNFAFCFDGDLLSGTSGPCDTFGNSCLAHSSEFELKNVENQINLLKIGDYKKESYLPALGIRPCITVPYMTGSWR